MKELLRYMKLEAVWILTNIAYGEEAEVLQLIQYGNEINFSEIMQNIFAQKDLILIDQIMYLMGNVTGTSKTARNLIRA